jgi:hypothetical protein
MKRNLIKIGVVLAALVLAVCASFLLWPQDRITKASFLKMQTATTEKEVEAVLGGPGVNFQEVEAHIKALEKPNDNIICYTQEKLCYPKPLKPIERFWPGRNGIMSIRINPKTGIIYFQQFMTTRSLETTFLDRLRDWLGW